jgi:hypothetical protein
MWYVVALVGPDTVWQSKASPAWTSLYTEYGSTGDVSIARHT